MKTKTHHERTNPIDSELDQHLANGLHALRPGIIEEIHRAYAPRLRQVVWPVLHDHAETEDVLQDILLHAHRRPQQFNQQKGALFSWLSTMARRRAIDRLRQRLARQRAKDGLETQLKQTATPHEPESTVARSANNRDLQDVFKQLMNRLPKRQEEVIRLKFFHYLSQREIAAKTDTSPSTVRTRLELGMQKLRNALESMGPRVC